MKKFRQPFGVVDYLPNECYNKEVLEQKISGVFYGAGFDKVKTGALEYYDLYDESLSIERKKRLFKLMDTDGSLLVLRPDITMQIGRMVATKLDKDSVHKLYYNENSYEYLPDSLRQSARSREFQQIGIEILGSDNVCADIEAVILAIKSLLECGLTDFLIEIGNIDFFNGLLAESGLSTTDAKNLKKLTNSKDTLGAELFLQDKKISQSTKNALLSLGSLYGDKAVLDKADKITSNKISKNALANLRDIIVAVEKAGYSKYVSVDLGLLKGGYYSGFVMRGVVKNVGSSILDGGRYNSFADSVGDNKFVCGVGFAIGTKRLLVALERQQSLLQYPVCDFAYINVDGFSELENKTISELNKKGKRAVKQYFASKTQLLEYCKKHKIANAIVFSGNKAEDIKVSTK